jgi:hypothetical protein
MLENRYSLFVNVILNGPQAPFCIILVSEGLGLRVSDSTILALADVDPHRPSVRACFSTDLSVFSDKGPWD